MNHDKRRGRHRAWLAALAVLSCVLAVMGLFQGRQVAALTHQVNASYEKSLYEAVTLMNGIQLNLEKLLVSHQRNQEEKLLGHLAQQAEGAQANLSAIPINPELITGAMKFVNQLGDYAVALSKKLVDGEKLRERDIAQLTALHEASVALNQSLFDLAGQYEQGELVFEVPTDLRTAAKGLRTRAEPMVDYPVLLYDGPFSDADRAEVPLSGEPVDVIGAQRKLVSFVGAERVQTVQYQGESEIAGKCYEFALFTGDGTLTAGVTQLGGHVLYMLPDHGIEGPTLTQGECIDMAQAFLMSRGYGKLEVSYWRQFGALLTVNFAAAQGEVLLYPDLIKVQVSMVSGLVVGIEAGNYLKNHKTRYLAEPMVQSQAALEQLSPVLTPDRIRRCVIPLEAGGEAQCWEISAYMEGGNRYLVYIDALSGEERQILRVMVEEDGVLTQ